MSLQFITLYSLLESLSYSNLVAIEINE